MTDYVGSTNVPGTYNTSGNQMQYQAETGGPNDPFSNYNARLQSYNSAPGYDSAFNWMTSTPYNPQDYAYQVPTYNVGANENVDGLVGALESDAANQMGLMNRTIDQGAAINGMSGGSRHGTAQAAGVNDINRGLMNASADVRYKANENALQRQYQEAEARRQSEQQAMQFQAQQAQAQAQQDQSFQLQQQLLAMQDAQYKYNAGQQEQQDAFTRESVGLPYGTGGTNSAGRAYGDLNTAGR